MNGHDGADAVVPHVLKRHARQFLAHGGPVRLSAHRRQKSDAGTPVLLGVLLHVLHEVGESFLNYQVVANREQEQRADDEGVDDTGVAGQRAAESGGVHRGEPRHTSRPTRQTTV